MRTWGTRHLAAGAVGKPPTRSKPQLLHLQNKGLGQRFWHPMVFPYFLHKIYSSFICCLFCNSLKTSVVLAHSQGCATISQVAHFYRLSLHHRSPAPGKHRIPFRAQFARSGF